jgi:hypothetical protein
MRAALVVAVILAASPAAAQRWQDATASCLGTTAEWSNKIELADVDGDGLVDILVANGGSYSTPGAAEPTRIWKNLGNWDQPGVSHCSEISSQAVLGLTGSSRMIKVADVDGDGDLDILTGGAWHTQLRLFLREGDHWVDATAQLPQQLTSIGDAEFGDVDGDGDLDIVLAEWGTGNPGDTNYQGGRTRLYLNDGHGNFTEATDAQMPATLIKWSWDLELVDVDNDFDLDILVSCKLCSTSYLFRNDGTGHFTQDDNALPHFSNNYDFAVMDIDGDGFLDLATINDGVGSKNHIFHNRGDGTFADESAERMTATANPGADDNQSVWLDVDDDGDADLLVASLSGPERLLLNDGTGHFTLAPGSATPDDTPGSLGIAVGDLDGDGRLDVVQAQGEVAFPEKVQLATAMVAVDTHPPVVAVEEVHGGGRVRARVHDHQSPYHAHDFQKISLVVDGTESAMTWYGEYLFAGTLPATWTTYKVCATDRRGNPGCSREVGPVADGPRPGDDAGVMGETKPGGCCDSSTARGSLVPVIAVALLRRRRRYARCRAD